MKALILAAGLGTRLAPITDDRPKSLVPVNGKPILIKQIENLLENGITDITVISGCKGDMLKKQFSICILISRLYIAQIMRPLITCIPPIWQKKQWKMNRF